MKIDGQGGREKDRDRQEKERERERDTLPPASSERFATTDQDFVSWTFATSLPIARRAPEREREKEREREREIMSANETHTEIERE